MPEQYRFILYLREYHSFSYQEIMEALQLLEEQLKVTLYRARKRLVQLAEKKGWEYDEMDINDENTPRVDFIIIDLRSLHDCVINCYWAIKCRTKTYTLFTSGN